MAIPGVNQPDIIQIDNSLRLRKYDGEHHFALAWYQDTELVYLVDGDKTLYTIELLEKMFTYWNNSGELYFIEIFENENYKPIGDVTFSKEDMPIVIGEQYYRGKGIGRKVIKTLVERGRELGYKKLYVEEIYSYNEGSRRCFESVGFKEYEKTKEGSRYVLNLS